MQRLNSLAAASGASIVATAASLGYRLSDSSASAEQFVDPSESIPDGSISATYMWVHGDRVTVPTRRELEKAAIQLERTEVFHPRLIQLGLGVAKRMTPAQRAQTIRDLEEFKEEGLDLPQMLRFRPRSTNSAILTQSSSSQSITSDILNDEDLISTDWNSSEEDENPIPDLSFVQFIQQWIRRMINKWFSNDSNSTNAPEEPQSYFSLDAWTGLSSIFAVGIIFVALVLRMPPP